MSRLATTFAALRQRGERALVPYVTAGDPSLPVSARLMAEAARRGADIVEVGEFIASLKAALRPAAVPA